MFLRPIYWTLALALVGSASAQAQNAPATQPGRAPLRDHNVILPGLLTQRMLDGMIAQTVGDLAGRYEWDAEQAENIRALLRRRATEFLRRRAPEIQDVALAFMETRLNTEPPSQEFAADWSTRAGELLTELRAEVSAGVEDAGDVLTEEQFARLSADVGALDAGLSLVDGKLRHGAAGGFDPGRDWEQLRPGDSARGVISPNAPVVARADESHEKVEPIGKTSMAIASQPADEWAAYTERFIRRYQLDDAQSQRARTLLQVAQSQRDARQTSHREALAQARRRVAEARTDEERSAAREALEKQLAPFERMFTRLREKLDSLPTRAQRTAAAAGDREEAAPR